MPEPYFKWIHKPGNGRKLFFGSIFLGFVLGIFRAYIPNVIIVSFSLIIGVLAIIGWLAATGEFLNKTR